MEGRAASRNQFKIRMVLVIMDVLVVISQTQAQFTACTTRGNHTSHIYRQVPIKNARTSVTISSPNFPLPYPQNIQCTWRIIAPLGYQVKMSFLTFELEQPHLISGCHDYVSVRQGGEEFNNAKEIRRRCGLTKPPDVRSEGQILWVRFTTDMSVERKGFTIKVIPATGSSSKRYIALAILLTMLAIIIIAIIICRKHFQRKQKEENTPKILHYQELSIPSGDTDNMHIIPKTEDPEECEELPRSPVCRPAGRDKTGGGVLYLRTLRGSEGSGYCSLSEDGVSVENETHRCSGKRAVKKSANERDDLEYTELLTVL